MAIARRINTFLPDFFEQHGLFNTIGPVVVNAKESIKGFDVDLMVPGFSKENFTVKVDNGVLQVTAKRDAPFSSLTSEGLDIGHASYERNFNLPANTDENDISARFEGGLLKLSISKKDGPSGEVAKIIEIK